MKALFKSDKLLISVFFTVIIAFGIFARFHKITQNQFFYYDEGLYIGFNRKNAEIIANALPLGFSDLWRALKTFSVVALASTKALWVFLIDMRIFILNVHDWYFARVLSAVSALLTLFMVYIFSLKLFKNKLFALLSVGILAVFPSHVFYSRMAMQESLSTLFFITTFYFYLYPKKFGWNTFVAGVMAAGAYYTNYRLIIFPIHLFCVEVYFLIFKREQFSLRRFIWTNIVFFTCLFWLGNLGAADNTYATFSWMMLQAGTAKEVFSWLNYLSYPYYLYKFESPILLVCMLISFSWLIKKDKISNPLAIVCLIQMIIFSVAMEKGVRYLAVVYPFISMCVAYVFVEFFNKYQKRGRLIIIMIFLMMMSIHVLKILKILRFNSDYEPAISDILRDKPDSTFASTQMTVQDLFTERGRVLQCPNHFWELKVFANAGYDYLIVGPQAYIANTYNLRRFVPQLQNYLQYIVDQEPPVAVYDHFNQGMMERFVFEHSENLKTSIEFLKISEGIGAGKLRVYDIPATVNRMELGMRRYRMVNKL